MRTDFVLRSAVLSAASLVLAVSAFSGTPAPAADWPGWRGPDRDGKSTETGLLKQWPDGGPKQLWHATGIGSGFSSAAIADGAVYITGMIDGKCVISAFDLSGNRKWQKVHGPAWTGGHKGVRASPVIDDGRLYLLSGPGKIGCYDLNTRELIWTRHMNEFDGVFGGWGFSESPLITSDLVVVTPGRKQCLVALDKRTGKTKWISPGNGGSPHYSSAIYVVHDGVPMIINGTSSGLLAVDPDDGRVLWTNDFSAGNTANCPTPAYSDGYVFWANGYGKGGVCLKLQADGRNVTAREVYRTKQMVCHHGGYVIHQGYVYGNHGGGWNCLELATGKKMWGGKGPGKGSACFADGMLYLFGENGGKASLVAAKPDGYEISGSFKVQGSGPSWAYPVVAGGRLYLRYADNLYCFDVKGR